jgi:hypothetical protein
MEAEIGGPIEFRRIGRAGRVIYPRASELPPRRPIWEPARTCVEDLPTDCSPGAPRLGPGPMEIIPREQPHHAGQSCYFRYLHNPRRVPLQQPVWKQMQRVTASPHRDVMSQEA